MLAELLSLGLTLIMFMVLGILDLKRLKIREDALVRRIEIASRGTASKDKAAAIEAALRPWWRYLF